MSAHTALAIVATIILGTLAFGILAVKRIRMDPEQFIVGGRSFGWLLMWLLMAGEFYTTFTFLGAAGWAYGRGAPAFYILCYGTVAYVISYFMLPAIWRVARERRALTGPDFFVAQYDSRLLGGLVALVGFVFLIPYVTLQLTGIALLLRIAGYGTLNTTLAVGVAFAAMAAFTFFSGLHGTAWTSIVKDLTVLAGVLIAGIVLPIHYFGSPAGAIGRVLAAHPDWLTLAAPGAPNGSIWFVSTVVLTACGFFMFPQSMAATFAARDEDTLRRNAIFLPLYQLMILLVFFAGLTALIVYPGLKGPDADQSFMLLLQRDFPAWLVGFVAGAGTLAGLVPASAQILGAASIVSKNVLGEFGILRNDAQQTLATRILVVVVAALAFAFWAVAKQTLVGLLLIAYNGMSQFFPGVVLSLVSRRRPAPLAVGCGIVAGLAVLVYFSLAGTSGPAGLNTGAVALIVNAIVLGLVQAAIRASRVPALQR